LTEQSVCTICPIDKPTVQLSPISAAPAMPDIANNTPQTTPEVRMIFSCY
jgi:hypothetical protein